MTKKVKPMHSPAGTPGNMQDVSDLQQMLAQSQAEIATLTKSNAHLKKTVATLTEQRDDSQSTIADLRKKVESLEEKIEADETEELRERISELEDAMFMQGEDAQSLIQIREGLFRGDAARAREDLEIFLNRLVPTWRCGGCNVGQMEIY